MEKDIIDIIEQGIVAPINRALDGACDSSRSRRLYKVSDWRTSIKKLVVDIRQFDTCNVLSEALLPLYRELLWNRSGRMVFSYPYDTGDKARLRRYEATQLLKTILDNEDIPLVIFFDHPIEEYMEHCLAADDERNAALEDIYFKILPDIISEGKINRNWDELYEKLRHKLYARLKSIIKKSGFFTIENTIDYYSRMMAIAMVMRKWYIPKNEKLEMIDLICYRDSWSIIACPYRIMLGIYIFPEGKTLVETALDIFTPDSKYANLWVKCMQLVPAFAEKLYENRDIDFENKIKNTRFGTQSHKFDDLLLAIYDPSTINPIEYLCAEHHQTKESMRKIAKMAEMDTANNRFKKEAAAQTEVINTVASKMISVVSEAIAKPNVIHIAVNKGDINIDKMQNFEGQIAADQASPGQITPDQTSAGQSAEETKLIE